MRKETYELIRRRIRNDGRLFGEQGERKERQCERVLALTANRLRKHWQERADQLQHEYGQRLLRMYS